MTPLKAASRAYVNAGSEYHGKPNKTIYDAFRDEDQKEADDAMRAALMALAEAQMSDDIMDKGIDIYAETATAPSKLREGFAVALRAMLHSICHADTEQAENQGSASLPSDQSNYLREALKSKAYFSFYMDGRNEHGTHLLEAGGSNILNPETILEVIQDQHHELAEKIFKTAERLGHEAGHCIVTEWEWDDGGECSGYYGYGGVNTILTEALHGTPEEQRVALSQIEEPMGDEVSQHGDGQHDTNSSIATNNREAE